MDRERKIVGFDRQIRLSWLDATADWAAQGLSTADIRTRLDRLLDGQVAGSGPHSARGKTMTVLTHVWVLVPDTLGQLRNDGFNLLDVRSARDRLPLHWGMCLATYPFFRDVAETTGRLLALQGRATLSQIVRRATESWGARSTVVRATQRIVRSFVAWDALGETRERGVFVPATKIMVADSGLGSWLLGASVNSSNHGDHPLPELANATFLFPFDLRVSPARHRVSAPAGTASSRRRRRCRNLRDVPQLVTGTHASGPGLPCGDGSVAHLQVHRLHAAEPAPH